MDAFAAAIESIFADPNIARDAVWRAGGVGDGIPVRVVTRRPDQAVGFGDSRAILPAMLIEVRRSEAPDIAEGDLVEIGPDVFRIIAEPVQDSLDLVAVCEAAKAEA